MRSLDDFAARKLGELDRASLHRVLVETDRLDGIWVERNGRRLLSFSSRSARARSWISAWWASSSLVNAATADDSAWRASLALRSASLRARSNRAAITLEPMATVKSSKVMAIVRLATRGFRRLQRHKRSIC